MSFGLVNIGVELHTMEKSERLDLDLLDKRDMGRIGYQKINKSTGEPVESKDIVKGYAVSKNKHVVHSDEDIKSAHPKASRTVEVIGFVEEGSIGRIHYARPYLVAPGQGSAKAYRLLHDVELPAKGTAKAAEVQMAEKLVETMVTTWDPSEYKDSYRDNLMKLIKARAKKGAQESEEPPKPEKDETPVLDLMAALTRSLAEEKGGGARIHSPAARVARCRLQRATDWPSRSSTTGIGCRAQGATDRRRCARAVDWTGVSASLPASTRWRSSMPGPQLLTVNWS